MERDHEGSITTENGQSTNTYWSRLQVKGSIYHEKVPLLRTLPLPAIAIVALLIVVNLTVWISIAIVLHWHTSLVSTAVLSYTLGLRHALDADHISAIDLMTRRLVASGQRPVTVGTFFSLGHSTIVVITCIVVASTAEAVYTRFNSFSYIGGIIGSSVSATFLIVLGVMNVYILYKLVSELRRLINTPSTGNRQQDMEFNFEGGGIMFRLLKKMFRIIDRPWKMYPLGVMFGLGFDTSSEVALLGISALSATKGTSIWLILIYPVLFTAGMCLLDTLDGALMMSLYTSTRLAKDMIAVLYYQSVLTGITVVVAIVIGVIQLLSMVQSVANPGGKFWEGVAIAGDNYDIIGGGICGSFVLFGTVSAILYKPWRRRIDAKRAMLHPNETNDELCDLELERTETAPLEGIHGAPKVIAGSSTQKAGPPTSIKSDSKGGTRTTISEDLYV